MSIGGITGGQPDFSAMRAKMDAKISEMFAANDTDGSGGLSMEEFSSAHDARKAEGGHEGPRGVGGARPSAEDMFTQMDQDQDGQVTEQEMLASRPSPPHGNFQVDTMSSLLSMQEESQEDSISQILSAALESTDDDEETEDDLISQL